MEITLPSDPKPKLEEISERLWLPPVVEELMKRFDTTTRSFVYDIKTFTADNYGVVVDLLE